MARFFTIFSIAVIALAAFAQASDNQETGGAEVGQGQQEGGDVQINYTKRQNGGDDEGSAQEGAQSAGKEEDFVKRGEEGEACVEDETV